MTEIEQKALELVKVAQEITETYHAWMMAGEPQRGHFRDRLSFAVLDLRAALAARDLKIVEDR